MRWVSFIIVYLLLGLFSGTEAIAATESTNAYRVAGIITIDAKSAAFVEMSNGDFVLLHEGDKLEDGTVMEITHDWLRVSFPEGEQLLGPIWSSRDKKLLAIDEINAKNASTTTKSDAENNIVLGEEAKDDSLVQKVAVKPMQDQLSRLSAKLSNNSDPTNNNGSNAENTEEEKEPSKTLGELLGPSLNLPQDARIVGVGGMMPITSAKNAVDQFNQSLGRGDTVIIFVEGIQDYNRIYIMPQ